MAFENNDVVLSQEHFEHIYERHVRRDLHTRASKFGQNFNVVSCLAWLTKKPGGTATFTTSERKDLETDTDTILLTYSRCQKWLGLIRGGFRQKRSASTTPGSRALTRDTISFQLILILRHITIILILRHITIFCGIPIIGIPQKTAPLGATKDIKVNESACFPSYQRFRWHATLKNKTPAETFPNFSSFLRVINIADRNPPITATSIPGVLTDWKLYTNWSLLSEKFWSYFRVFCSALNVIWQL